MANFNVTFYQEVADVDGNIAVVSAKRYLADTSTMAVIITSLNDFGTALVAATNGKVVRASFKVQVLEAQLIPGSTPPVDALYPSVTDGARMNFSNSDGATGHITVPAPTGTTFLDPPLRDIVDPTGDAAALITWMQTYATDSGGTHLNLYQGGIKVGRGARKRRPPKAGLT
jgi:hypothetical protein